MLWSEWDCSCGEQMEKSVSNLFWILRHYPQKYTTKESAPVGELQPVAQYRLKSNCMFSTNKKRKKKEKKSLFSQPLRIRTLSHTVAFPVVYSASWLILETSGELFIIVFTRESGNVLEVLSAMMKALQLERRKYSPPPPPPQAPEKSEQTRKRILLFSSSFLWSIFRVYDFL